MKDLIALFLMILVIVEGWGNIVSVLFGLEFGIWNLDDTLIVLVCFVGK